MLVFRPLCYSGYDPDTNADDEEEKRRLITQVLELQNTLDGWSLIILTANISDKI